MILCYVALLHINLTMHIILTKIFLSPLIDLLHLFQAAAGTNWAEEIARELPVLAIVGGMFYWLNKNYRSDKKTMVSEHKADKQSERESHLALVAEMKADYKESVRAATESRDSLLLAQRGVFDDQIGRMVKTYETQLDLVLKTADSAQRERDKLYIMMQFQGEIIAGKVPKDTA